MEKGAQAMRTMMSEMARLTSNMLTRLLRLLEVATDKQTRTLPTRPPRIMTLLIRISMNSNSFTYKQIVMEFVINFSPLNLLECSKDTPESHLRANKVSCYTGNNHFPRQESSSS